MPFIIHFLFIGLTVSGLLHAKSEGTEEQLMLPGICAVSLAALPEHETPFTEAFFEAARQKVLNNLTGQRRAINQFFDNIKGWYLTPSEERTTPTIVLLTGMTAVGKTTLPFQALAALKLIPETLYLHVENYSGENGSGETFGNDLLRKVEEPIEIEGIKGLNLEVRMPVRPQNPVVILDEMQKLNTLDSDSKTVSRPQAKQFFEFLGNDGRLRLNNPLYTSLKNALDYPSWYMEKPEGLGDADRSVKKDFKNRSRAELMRALKEIPPQVELDYSSALVVIMLNLDSVYLGSATANPESITADESHQRTSKITATDVRGGLLKLWRPEHVRRLGARYISFPTFSEAEFREYMNKQMAETKFLAQQRSQMDLSFSDEFVERIYNEGVIPTQGLSPLKETLKIFILDPIPTMKAYLREDLARGREIKVEVGIAADDGDYSEWRAIVDGETREPRRFFIPSDFKNSVLLRDEPLRTHVAIRLAAKVATGIKVFEQMPAWVRANSRVTGRDGVIQFSSESTSDHYKFRSKLFGKIGYFLSSLVMEHLVYGEGSSMSNEDLDRATSYANHLAKNGMVKAGLGFEIREPEPVAVAPERPKEVATPQRTLTPTEEVRSMANLIKSMVDTVKDMRTTMTDVTPFLLNSSNERPNTHLDVESIMRESFRSTSRLLQEQRPFIVALARELTEKIEISESEIRKIFERNWVGEREFVKDASMTEGHKFLSDEGFGFKLPRVATTPESATSEGTGTHDMTNVITFPKKTPPKPKTTL